MATTSTNRVNFVFAGERITPAVRSSMSLMPPPVMTHDGEAIPYDDDYVSRYADLAEMKKKYPLWMEDSLDDEVPGPDRTLRRKLFIRCLSSDGDLLLILAAARHLELISSFSVERGETEHLAKNLESGYIIVHYSLAVTEIPVDVDASVFLPNCVDERRIREIWRGLFKAAGYRPRFDTARNVRRQRL